MGTSDDFLSQLTSPQPNEGTDDASGDIAAEQAEIAKEKDEAASRRQSFDYGLGSSLMFPFTGFTGGDVSPETARRVGSRAKAATDVAIDAATLYAPDDIIAGAGQALSSLFTDNEERVNREGSMFDYIREQFEEGKADREATTASARSELGTLPSLALETLTSLNKASGPARLAKAIEETIGFRPSQSLVGRFTKNPLQQGMVGGIEAGLTSALQGETDALDLFGAAASGTVGGAAGQVLLGEIAGPLFKYGVLNPITGRGSAERVGDVLFDTTAGSPGATPTRVRGAYQEMVENNLGLTDLDIGTTTRADMVGRFVEGLQKTALPRYTLANDADRQAFAELVGQSYRIMQDTQERMQTSLSSRLGSAKSRWERWRTGRTGAREAATEYDSMFNTKVQGKGGNSPVVFKNFRDSFTNRVFEEAGVAGGTLDARLQSLDPSVRTLMSQVMNDISPVRQHKRGTVYRPRAKDEFDNTHLNPQEIDLETARTNLVSLLNARKKLSETIKPGRLINGSSVTPSEVRSSQIVIRALDQEIANRTLRRSDAARKAFATHMEAVDAEEVGNAFYSQRLSNDPEYGKSMEEYINGLQTTTAKDAFRDGYKNAFIQATADNGIVRELNALLGVTNLKEGIDDLSNINTARLEDLRMILGRKEADNLIREVYESASLNQQAKDLTTVLDIKGASGAAIDGLVRDADDIIMSGAVTGRESTLLANATIGAFARQLEQLKPEDAVRMSRLLSARGQEAVNLTEESLRAMEFPSNPQVGGRLGAMIGERTSQLTDEEAAEAREEEKGRYDAALQSLYDEVNSLMDNQ